MATRAVIMTMDKNDLPRTTLCTNSGSLDYLGYGLAKTFLVDPSELDFNSPNAKHNSLSKALRETGYTHDYSTSTLGFRDALWYTLTTRWEALCEIHFRRWKNNGTDFDFQTILDTGTENADKVTDMLSVISNHDGYNELYYKACDLTDRMSLTHFGLRASKNEISPEEMQGMSARSVMAYYQASYLYAYLPRESQIMLYRRHGVFSNGKGFYRIPVPITPTEAPLIMMKREASKLDEM